MYVPTNTQSALLEQGSADTHPDTSVISDQLGAINHDLRRVFIKTALSAGFAVAVSPVCAQTQIKTDTEGLQAGEIRVPTSDGMMPAYSARPSPKHGHHPSYPPVILVIQEIFGVHEYIRDVCRRLAKEGYMAIAPELYARQGEPELLPGISDIISQIVSKVADKQVYGDLDACVKWAEIQGGNAQKLGITGFCWGGRITWMYSAHNPNVKAGVAWYGRLVGESNQMTPLHPSAVANKIKAPILGLYGGADSGIPVETVTNMRTALQAGGNTSSEIIVYPDMPHGFHADYRNTYRQQAAQDGWQKMLGWFKKQGLS